MTWNSADSVNTAFSCLLASQLEYQCHACYVRLVCRMSPLKIKSIITKVSRRAYPSNEREKVSSKRFNSRQIENAQKLRSEEKLDEVGD